MTGTTVDSPVRVPARRPRARVVDRGVRRVVRRLLAGACGCLLALVAVEGSVRVSGLDRRAVASALYFQPTDVGAYRVSAHPRLLYELRPGADLRSAAGGVRVRVDRHGARGAEHPEPKPVGTFRILCFGASTLFGAALEDEETLPAFLERHLTTGPSPGDAVSAGSPPPRYEAWNFGASGYVLSQMAVRAQLAVPLHDPDLVVVLYSNETRRPFLAEKGYLDRDYRAFLDADPDLWLENLPEPPWLATAAHLRLLRSFAAWRYLRAARREAAPTGGANPSLAHAFRVDETEAGALEAEAARRGIPVVYALIPSMKGRGVPTLARLKIPARRIISLYEAGHPDPWYDLHPAADAMSDHARILARELAGRGFLDPE